MVLNCKQGRAKRVGFDWKDVEVLGILLPTNNEHMNPIKPVHPSTSFFFLLRRRLHESTLGSRSPTPPLGYRVLLLTSTTIPTITLFMVLLKHGDLLVTITRKCRMQLRNPQSLIPLGHYQRLYLLFHVNLYS